MIHRNSAPDRPQKEEPSREQAEADHQLALRLREDPHAAAAAIYDRFAVDVNRWVWRLLGADAEQHDVVQQVFLRILRAGRRLRDPHLLAPWVRAVTVNTVYGELRRREVRRVFLRQRDPDPIHLDFVREVEVRDLLVRAKSILKKLPAKEQVVFLLHHVEGCTLHEVAELCGYSQATAKRRLHEAQRRFTSLLANHPELARSLNAPKEPSHARG